MELIFIHFIFSFSSIGHLTAENEVIEMLSKNKLKISILMHWINLCCFFYYFESFTTSFVTYIHTHTHGHIPVWTIHLQQSSFILTNFNQNLIESVYFSYRKWNRFICELNLNSVHSNHVYTPWIEIQIKIITSFH